MARLVCRINWKTQALPLKANVNDEYNISNSQSYSLKKIQESLCASTPASEDFLVFDIICKHDYQMGTQSNDIEREQFSEEALSMRKIRAPLDLSVRCEVTWYL
jgi:hypothetical protein